MDSIGIINASYIVEYDKNSENYENLDNKFIVKVKSSSLDDVIILFKESNFERFIREAFNCFIVCVEFDNIEEEEEIDDEYTAMRLEGTFKADRLIILQLNQSLWIKNCLQRKFFNMKSAKMWKYKNFLEDLNFGENILNSKLEFMHAIDYIKPETGEFVIKMIKLFKFSNQKEVDRKLFEVAIERKCSFEVIQSMISFHKNKESTSNGMSKHEVDALFLARGITVFDEEVIENYRQELRKDDKEKITDEIEKFHGNEKSLLQHLCSRSKVALATKEAGDDRLKKIEQYYQNLIDLSEDAVTDLLRIVDHKLLIIFDFDSNSIERSYLMGTKNNRGIFDQDRMRIFIGAKNSHDTSSDEYTKREWEIVGILIHEVCHYVNFKVFNNNCKPYKPESNIQKYEDIIEEYGNWTDHNEIVGRVFEDYEESMWHAELIVRVVQIIVTYKILDPEQLNELEEKYKKLFSYFYDVVIPQVKTYLDPDNQLKRQIKEISSFNLEKFDIKPIVKPLKYDQEKYIHFVETNVPKLAMANFCLSFVEDFVIVTTFKDLMDEFKGNEILSLCCSDWRIKIVIYCDKMYEDSKYFKECVKKLDNPDRINQIFFIFKENSKNVEKLIAKFTKKAENLGNLSFSIFDLIEQSRKNILERNVIFQGTETKLNKIIKNDSNAAQFLPFNHFLESSDPLVIGKLPEKNADYDDKVFIHRKLSNKAGEEVSEFSTEEIGNILSLLSTNQYIIISDEVGKGKSTLMTHLAYQFLQSTLSHIDGKFFVVKINLHQHSNIFAKFKNDTRLDEFIFENFVKKSCFEEFEWKVFEEYYNEGKIILMLDGFDEITNKCEEQTLQIIQKVISLSSSNIIVATRPLYTQKLNNSGGFILNIEHLSEQDQIKFLINCLKSQTELSKKISEAEIVSLCIKSIFRMSISMRESFDSNGQFINPMLSFPLHLKMFADAVCNKILKNESSFEDVTKSIEFFKIYHLYDNFFQNKVRIALENKGDVIKDELRNFEHKGFKRLRLFESAGKLAWNTLHPAFKADPLKIDEREKKFLQRYGIVSFQNDDIYFVHRSFAEFLIAHLFLENLINGTLSSSHFAQNHFLIDVLTLEEYKVVKELIDTALSDEDIYKDISEESFKDLGELVIKEFKEMEGNDKNFLHCVIEDGKKYNLEIALMKNYVFVSHLLLNSLIYCDSEEDIETIKNILEMPWNNECINIFQLVCNLGINCLVLIVMKVVEKMYENEAKNYFFNWKTVDKENVNVLELALHRASKSRNIVLINPCRVNIRNCLQIHQLRELKYLDDDDIIDLNEDCNFHLSTAFILLLIIKTFNLTENDLELICPLTFDAPIHSTMGNIYLKLNFYYYFLSKFFKSQKNVINLKYKICNLISCIVAHFTENFEINIRYLFNFLKERLSDEYTVFMKHFFIIFFKNDIIPINLWPLFNIEIKALLIYLHLHEILNENSDDIAKFFQFHPSITSTFLRSGDFNNIIYSLEIYLRTLDEDHLALMLLNESFANLNIINHIAINFPLEYLEQFLKLLEKSFCDKQKLYFIVKKSVCSHFRQTMISNSQEFMSFVGKISRYLK